ncbi:MAG: c-type cytochrome domain-containing protein, partial [Akkermansiaceae bacterium]
MHRSPLFLFLLSTQPSFAATENIDLSSQIQPNLSENCYACHGPDEATIEGGLRLDVQELAFKGGDSGKAIVPRKADASLIMERILHTDPKEVMPPPDKKKRLSPEK